MRRLSRQRAPAAVAHRRAGNMPIDVLMSLGVVTTVALALYLLAQRSLMILMTVQDIVVGWPYR